MPFNLLLLPLLAGFLFLSRSNLRAYWTSQLTKDLLLLYAALAGAVLLAISRTLCFALLQTRPGMTLAECLHAMAPFPFIGTALGTLVLAQIAVVVSNFLVSEHMAGFWLYHRGQFDPLAKLLWQSAVGIPPQRMCSGPTFTGRIAKNLVLQVLKALGWRRALTKPWLTWTAVQTMRTELPLELAGLQRGVARAVMLFMKDGRVIVAYVVDILTSRPNVEFFTVLPIWTGHRDGETNRVVKTTDYGEALERAPDPSALSRVIRTTEIAYATLFSESAFPFDPPKKIGKKAAVRRRPNRRVATPRPRKAG